MIIADSGPVVALLIPSDQHHAAVSHYFSSVTEPIWLPTVTLAEISHFLLDRSTPQVEARFLRSLVGFSIELIDPLEADYLRAADLVEQYADFPLGTVDATIVAIAERLDVAILLTLDRRHFGAIRPAHRPSFEIVP